MKRIATLLGTLLIGAAPHLAQAQNFPTRPITIVVPIGPGGGYDFTGRLLAEGMAKDLGQPVVVENRPGAGTVVGTQYVVNSAPDGHTLVIGGVGSIAHAPMLIKDLPYNPGTDLVPLQLVNVVTYTLAARNDLGPKTLQDVIAYAKANPGKLSAGTPGQGTGQAVVTALLKSLAGIDLLEVQYKNAPPVYIDMMGGRVDLFFDATGTAQSFVKSGKVRAIVTSGADRDPTLPDVPTARESGLRDLVMEGWMGLFAPSKTPRPIVLRLRESINKVAAAPEFKKQVLAQGQALFTPPDVEAYIRNEMTRWQSALAKAGLKPQ
jgi:tripartite-type tricarboxylate transporter receptor subunit TctC